MTAKSLIKLLSIAFLFLFGAARVFAQAPVASATPLPCAKISISAPESVKVGGKLAMSIITDSKDPNAAPSYSWSITGSTIETGQGTSSITVTTEGLKAGTTLTAAVSVFDYDRNCSANISATTLIKDGAEARKFDEFTGVSTKYMKDRLETLSFALELEPKTTGYIIIYGGRTSDPDAWQKIAAEAKTYLTKKRGIDAARIVLVNGGYREESVGELWLVPEGATPPAASPTLNPRDVTQAKKTAAKKLKGKKS